VSGLHRACCCGAPAEECPSTCVCASSYSVTGVAFTYAFQYSESFPNCAECGQGNCLVRAYSINLTFVQDGVFVVARQTVGTSGATCCWYGTAELAVSGTVTLQEFRRCSGALDCNGPAQSWDVDTSVPCCLHVTCRPGAGDGCSASFSPRHYVHRLEVCDFGIACDGVLLGTIEDGACVPGVTCDDLGVCCEVQDYQVRCAGGSLTYVSRYECLENLGAGDSSCRGWHYTGARCNSPSCTGPNLDTNTATIGPFACYFAEACDQGLLAPPCEDLAAVTAIMRTYDPAWDSTLRDELRSYCASVDWSAGNACSVTDVIQAGCPSGTIPWTYA